MIQGAAFRVLAGFHGQDVRNFVELCEQAGYPTDLGGYYIRQLTKSGFIEKEERGQYHLLPKGKQQLALYYGKQLSALRPRLAVLLIARYGDRFVVLRRKVQPFVGAAEWPAVTVEQGEVVGVAATRALKSRLSEEGEATLVGFFRRIDLYGDTLFDDKIFAVHTLVIPAGSELVEDSLTGKNLLCTEQELYKLEKPGKALIDIFEYAKAGKAQFREQTYRLSLSDLALAG
ncbi:MAG TPA: hypothetical protein VFM05_10310 [Candidatus Saccharimonadales bacterium]|nr:hypothetical protein [Candidatus Saccharimonadales bacterium]